MLPAALFAPKGLTLFYTLVMTAIVCILLGCGVPTTPTYIIMVTVAAPALATMGVAPLVAHFFVFYYGVLAGYHAAAVALAAYAGASMAGRRSVQDPATRRFGSASPSAHGPVRLCLFARHAAGRQGLHAG